MPKLNLSAVINAPRSYVYDISQNYDVRFDWDPFPGQLEMLGGLNYEPILGGKVYVRGKMGLSMVVEFIQLQQPARAAVKMIKGPWFLELFAGAWVFHEVNEMQTRVEFVYTIKTKWLPFKKTMDAAATAYFSRVTNQRLIALKRYCDYQHQLQNRE